MPVEARVAAILRATWPLLPMPVTISRPRAAAHRSSGDAESAVERVGESCSQPVDLGANDPARDGEIARRDRLAAGRRQSRSMQAVESVVHRRLYAP